MNNKLSNAEKFKFFENSKSLEKLSPYYEYEMISIKKKPFL